VPASEIGQLNREHEERIKGLQAQADRAREREAEMVKAKGVESMLRLEFEQRLAKEKEILAAKYATEVDELRASQDTEIEKHDAKVRRLSDLRKSDHDRHAAELSVWHTRDHKFHAGLQGLEHALHGVFPLPLLHFCSFAPSPFLLVALVEAFPDSTKDATAAVEECRAEYHIVRHENPKAELSSEELMASIKGRLQPAARLGSQLRTTIASVFQVL
jgi:hypothetical protein